MLKKILTLFEVSEAQNSNEHSIELATAALLCEVIRADNQIDKAEVDSVKAQLAKHFTLTSDEVDALFEDSQTQAEDAVDLVSFTRVLNEHFDSAKRVALLESMWRTALADGFLDKHEEHMIRRIADLLYIPHSQYIQSKLSVTDKANS